MALPGQRRRFEIGLIVALWLGVCQKLLLHKQDCRVELEVGVSFLRKALVFILTLSQCLPSGMTQKLLVKSDQGQDETD